MRLAAVVVAVTLAAVGCGRSGDDGGAAAPAESSVPSSSTTPAAAPGYGAPVLLGELDDEALAESSGLAASRRTPGLLWTHNDSGDGPNVYCLTRQATRCGTWRVTGAEARDWEDMAAGPGPVAGEHYLYLGDIGDNDRSRTEVVVYRVPEPAAPSPSTDARATAPADALLLRYDDGPHDAEALLVHPTTGDLYVITKDDADAAVYKTAPDGGVLTRVAPFQLGLLQFVTGGDISPDGRRVVVSTYLRAFELTLPAGETAFDRIWAQPPRPVALPPRAQGESIAYRLDGAALLTTSEKTPVPLHEVVARR